MEKARWTKGEDLLLKEALANKDEKQTKKELAKILFKNEMLPGRAEESIRHRMSSIEENKRVYTSSKKRNRRTKIDIIADLIIEKKSLESKLSEIDAKIKEMIK